MDVPILLLFLLFVGIILPLLEWMHIMSLFFFYLKTLVNLNYSYENFKLFL